ncbi:Pao retrotransposon peptidase family protein [Trichinella spiralis]|uniref:Pao retrotransposon peptidase family protein n=1 Tax=Trichinella spiralis TaxID=6334 RepID=UPI0001EFC56A|nr:Pao retrotransposon peptidase family protein [Trichinella spiralis]
MAPRYRFGISPLRARAIVAGRVRLRKAAMRSCRSVPRPQRECKRHPRLSTIKARAFGATGSGITVTCLLDTGAEYSFIREDVAAALGVVGRAQPVKVEGSQVVQLWLSRLDGSQNAERYPLEALTVPSLCHRIPVSQILTSEWEHLQFLDPILDDESSDEVHVVIGIDYYYRFLGDAIRRGKPGDPVAVETVLGWIICGPVNPHPAPETVAAFNAVVEPSVEDLLRRFWEIEEMGVPFRCESDEVDPEKRFREGLSYDGTRYSVRLLWKNSGCWLPDNFAVAKRRLETLERRMAREPSRRDVHSSILHSYLVNGWAEEITSEGPQGRTWYLPHHVVSQQGPEAMKHRIVFDASVNFKGTSLNEQLDSGLKLQADLLGILLRFRRFRVALQSDIAKMFLQVGLREEDRDICRFLWRKDGPGGPIATYRLTRVCFGLACSPYLAMQVVNHHLREKRDCFGTVVDEIKAGMYVVDLVVSCDSIEEARDFAHRSSELLASGGFHLAKWASNAPEALADRPTEEIFRDGYSGLWKTLGVSWNPQEDELTFRPPELAANQDQETKRNLLRTAASVFDPLGGLTPFTVRAKRMFQSLWQTGMAWDDNLPAEVELQWRVWKLELNELPCIALPRAYFPFSPTEASRLELHGFGDASEAAYAAVVYLRAVKSPDDIQSGSAEEVEHSSARADGCSSLCLTGLLQLALDVEACHCWSDSKVALGWINGDANRWKPFVANRVREIQALTPSLWWRYIPTEDNPADLASRGCTVKNLSTSLKWWQGPTWLRGPPETWPEAEKEERIESLEVLEKELRATAVLVTVSPPQDAVNVINLGRYSSFERLIRVTAWCRRFRHNTTLPSSSRRTGTGLTSDELKEAERVWIRQEQIHAFGSKESLDKAMTKMLSGLNPFLDEFGVLRVGGRLGRAQLEEETKFPALLPRKGMIVDLLIRREHNRQLHAGVAQTLAALRERFWILRGRSAVKRVLRTCGICRRVAARPFQQRMGDLPAIRVNPARPFSNVGIDFVGPLLVRSENQTIESFLRALRRFVARRGRPDTIQSDNFRTFHQANAFLKHLFSGRNWETVQRHLASERVEWIFITERAPWGGGYWERLVRSVKTALKATLAAPDELRTVLCEVEARVNDRPLTFVGSDVDEKMALTPAHFLIGRSLASFPDRSNSADRGTLRSSLRHLLRRWSYQQKLVDAFWKRWKREYVVTLSSRGKWKKLHEQPRVGDVVLVADYNTPRRRWPLGRIVELLTGDDGLTRLAKVKTAAGTLCQSIRTLVLLEPAEAY